LKILVVDDEEFVTFHLRDLFRQRGHEVAVASSGVEAIRVATSDRFDLVLADVYMPGGSGLRMLARLRAEDLCRSTHVILMSALPTDELASEAIAAGADGFLPKPLALAEVVDEVEAFMGEKSPVAGATRRTTRSLVRPEGESTASRDGLKRGRIPTALMRRTRGGNRQV
jgi:CheY-like chemotaxis protein